MHYYQFNIGDYTSHTKGLSPIEDLAYRRLIDEYYLNEKPLSGCSTDVARMIGLKEYSDEVDYVLNRYFERNGDLWIHNCIDSDIADYQQKQEKRSNAGKKSAEARQKPQEDKQAFNTCSTHVQLTKNQEPLTNNQEPIKSISSPSENAPVQELIELFNEKFPELPKVKVLTDKRKAAVKRRWIDHKDRLPTVERWGDFFNWIRTSDFLMGRTQNPWNGFCFDWLFNPSNMVKILEGNYHTKAGEQ